MGLAVSGCARHDSPPSAAPPPKAVVVITDGAYHPATTRVPVGTRVTWVNLDEPTVTVETDGVAFFEFDRTKLDRQNRFDLHTLSVGEAESVVFDTPGRYDYHSSYDSTIKGTVIVERAP